MTFKPTGTEAKVCELIAKRQQLGIAKYGTTVADNPLTHRQWLQHGLEEALDLAIYLQRSLDELAPSGAGVVVAQEGKWRRAPLPVAKAPTAAPKAAIHSPAAQSPCLNDLADRSKGAVSVMGHFLELIESGNRQVVSIRVSTSLGDAVAYPNGLVFSEKVSIELELCK